MSDEITKSTKPTGFIPGQRLTGLAAKKAAAQAATGEPRVAEPEEMKHRLGILFDDSSSMAGQQILDAIEGTEEFLRSCVPNETAVAIQPLNATGLRLNTNLPAVAIFTKKMRAMGGTPMIRQINEMLYANKLTRAIVFSDGEPTDFRNGSEDDAFYQKILSYKIPIDTCYLPDAFIGAVAEAFMKKLAEDTGGIYLCFQRGKSNFRTAFKYLSPGLRYMLADKSFVAKLEGR